MRNARFILPIFLFFAGIAQGQSGYFGSRFSIDAHVNLGPSLQRSAKINYAPEGDEDGDIFLRRLRLSNTNYKLGFSFIASRKVELGFAFDYARMRSLSSSAIVDPSSGVSAPQSEYLDLMEDIVFNKSGFTIKTLIYVKGSKAPIGKYFGFSTNFGIARTVRDQVTYGTRGAGTSESNFFTRKNEIDALFMEEIDYIPTKGFYFGFRGYLGQNFPLTKKMMLNVAFGFPILNAYGSQGRYRAGIFMMGEGGPQFSGVLQDFASEFVDTGIFGVDDGDVTGVLFNTMFRYNRLQFDIGIKYYL